LVIDKNYYKKLSGDIRSKSISMTERINFVFKIFFINIHAEWKQNMLKPINLDLPLFLYTSPVSILKYYRVQESPVPTHTWSSAPIWSYRVGWIAPAVSRRNLLSAKALTSNFKPLHWLPLHYFAESEMITKVRARSVTAGQLIKSLYGPLVRKRFSLRSPQFYRHDANTKAHNTHYNTKDNPILSFYVYYILRTSFTPQPDSYCNAVTEPLSVVLHVAYVSVSQPL